MFCSRFSSWIIQFEALALAWGVLKFCCLKFVKNWYPRYFHCILQIHCPLSCTGSHNFAWGETSIKMIPNYKHTLRYFTILEFAILNEKCVYLFTSKKTLRLGPNQNALPSSLASPPLSQYNLRSNFRVTDLRPLSLKGKLFSFY